MLGFRIGPSLFWIASLIMFFLPWIDVSCRSRDGTSEDKSSISGAQLAWGGRTSYSDDGQHTWTLGEMRVKEDWRGMLVCGMLTAYMLGLLFAIGFVFIRSPEFSQAGIGLGIAILLLGLLLGGCWIAMEQNPLVPPDGGEMFKIRFTKWYFGSYVANVLAILSLGFVCWRMRGSSLTRRVMNRDPQSP